MHQLLRSVVTVTLFGMTVLQGVCQADEAHVARMFADNMVLQREMPAPVWGWAAPGTEVKVSFAGQTKQGKADPNGYWKVILDPLTASNEGRTLDIQIGATTTSIKNVLVGEVWIASGQSNMGTTGPDKDTGLYPHYGSPKPEAERPDTRLMVHLMTLSKEPLADLPEKAVATKNRKTLWRDLLPKDGAPRNVSIYSNMARVIRDALNVPVGIIHVAIGGTPQSAWMSRETMEAFPGYGKYEGKNFYEQMVGEHAKRSGDKINGHTPAVLYNTRIHPLAPFAVRGVIWHQGESGPRGPYGKRLVAMARQWRELFGQDFVFIWGTLARSTAVAPSLQSIPVGFYRSSVGHRRAAELFGDDPRAGLVELSDAGDAVTHFLQKAESGRRFGLAALTLAYGQHHVYTGPFLAELEVNEGKAVARFNHVGDGLVYTPSIDGISGFYIKGVKGGYRWADVRVLDTQSVEISHPEVARITAVAYGYHPNPYETLFNSAGLPASPFSKTFDGFKPDRRKPGTTDKLLRLQKPDGVDKLIPNIAHVRADGYVFQVFPGWRGNGPTKAPEGTVAQATAFIPSEWDGYEVECAGQVIDTEEATEDGRRFVTFQAPVSGKWIIVAAKGKAARFRTINRY